MRPVTEQNFGVLIAYILPGWVALLGAGQLSTEVRGWIGTPQNDATIGGFLYSSMSAVAIGLTLNMIRQAIVSTINAYTVKPRSRDYGELHTRIDAIEFLVLNQFRYHQFYGNSALAASFSLCVLAAKGEISDASVFLILGIVGVLIYGAINCLGTYYRRLDEVLSG